MQKLLAAARTTLLCGCLTLLVTKLGLAQEPPTAVQGSSPGLSQGNESSSSLSSSPGNDSMRDFPLNIAVERAGPAISCPDLPWFRARIASHVGATEHGGRYKITLTRKDDAWQARIHSWQDDVDAPAAERLLQDSSPGCKPLAEAVAVTVAILVDYFARGAQPDAAAGQEVESEEKVPSIASSEPPPAATVGSDSDSESALGSDEQMKSGFKVRLGAGGGLAMSWIAPITPLLGVSAAIDSGNWHHGLRLMATPEQKFELDPGRVVVQAWLATVLTCLPLAQGHVGAALCATADAGLLRARAEGFEGGAAKSRFYKAVGLEAHPSWSISDSYRVFAVLGALLPITQESFSVIGRGVAYEPPLLNWRILLMSELGAF